MRPALSVALLLILATPLRAQDRESSPRIRLAPWVEWSRSSPLYDGPINRNAEIGGTVRLAPDPQWRVGLRADIGLTARFAATLAGSYGRGEQQDRWCTTGSFFCLDATRDIDMPGVEVGLQYALPWEAWGAPIALRAGGAWEWARLGEVSQPQAEAQTIPLKGAFLGALARRPLSRRLRAELGLTYRDFSVQQPSEFNSIVGTTNATNYERQRFRRIALQLGIAASL